MQFAEPVFLYHTAGGGSRFDLAQRIGPRRGPLAASQKDVGLFSMFQMFQALANETPT